jgi:pimeloyl-ACP methyl ester carboxylesterase
VDQWNADVGLAIDELKDAAGLRSVSLVGLRLGALLAARAASTRTDVDGLVLWDPALSGTEWMHAIAPALAAATNGTVNAVGALGFPITPRLRTGLEPIEMASLAAVPGRPTYCVTSSEQPGARALIKAAKAAGAKATYECVPSPGSWNEVDYFGSALVPQAIIRAIVTWLTTER